MTSLIVCLLLFGFFAIQAQNIQIKGTVTSLEDGEPLPGVSVVVKGTNIGIATDVNGEYSLPVPSDATLVFSAVGMKTQEVAVAGQSVINLALESELVVMDEVVVTALGISREKKSLGYAVQDVNAEQLNNTIQQNALSMLSGKVAGLDVMSSTKIGGSSRILIRGATSITGENQPLIVLDGIPIDNCSTDDGVTANGYGGDANGFGGYDLGNMLNDLSPENIESVSVLKGPAAAIYGSRAANGVILITSKKAKATQRGYGVELSSTLGFDQVYMIPALQTKYGGGGVISDGDGGVNGFEQVNIDGTDYLIPQYQIDEGWGPRYDPNILVLPWNAYDQESFPDDYLKPIPWVTPENDVITFYELGVNFTNNIAITNAGEKHAIRLAYTNSNIKGTMPGSEQNKHNIGLTSSAKISKRIGVSSSLNYSYVYTKGRPQTGYGDNSTSKFYQWNHRQLDYEALKDYQNNDGSQRTWNRIYYDDPTPMFTDNPYWMAYKNYPDDDRTRFYGNLSLSYEIINGLTFKGSVYGDGYTFFNRERSAIGSQATSKYYERVQTWKEFNYEGILTYTKQLKGVNLTVFGGGNIRQTYYTVNRGLTSGGLVVPEIYNLLNSVDLALTNDVTEEKQVNSLFGSAAIDIKGMLFLEGTVRNDWSSTLPEDNNSYFYPSASASFLFSELLEDVNWLSLGKLRFGWAQVGNDTDPYKVYPVYEYDPSGPFQGAPRLAILDYELLNADLKAETTTSTEAGIDLSFVQNRISLNFTWYNNVTTDQIMPLEVSKSTGYDVKWINAGQMTNTGIEISLGLTPVRMDNFEWNFMTNFSKYKNTLDELYEGVDAIDLDWAPFSGAYLRAAEGEAYGQLYTYDFLYDSDGNRVVGANGYWRRTPELVPVGSVLPDYTMGIRNSFTILKAIDLSVLFDIRKGGKYYSVNHMWSMYAGMAEATAAVNDLGNEIRLPVAEGGGIKLDGVTGDVTFNDDGTYTVTNTAPNERYVSGPGYCYRFYHGYGMPSAQSVFNQDFIKLREVTIGYNLPAKILGPIQSARIALYGRNLLTFGVDEKGYDPEALVNGSGNTQGLDGGIYPTNRTFGVNLQLGF
ncbi:MAG: hypothetical protein A2Y71_03840 [Bacteroidetes bacterium RBG_13_42_15]|nr:MAG: hypothetical protein A2Y71_03840 [Bacteroidetes bacterium RBG_13_42_15]